MNTKRRSFLTSRLLGAVLVLLACKATCAQSVLTTPTFQQVPGTSLEVGYPYGLVVGNFNGDAYPDIVCGENVGNSKLIMMPGTGGTALGSATSTNVSQAPGLTNYYVLPIGASDLNGDGLDDVVCVTESGLVNMITPGVRVVVALGDAPRGPCLAEGQVGRGVLRPEGGRPHGGAVIDTFSTSVVGGGGDTSRALLRWVQVSDDPAHERTEGDERN